MDIQNTVGGSLQISTDVIAKIAELAAMEIDGVAAVSAGSLQSVRGLLGKTSLQKAVQVEMQDGVANVTVRILAKYGCKIIPVCEKVQENAKNTIQNMTGITVSRINVAVVGLAEPVESK